jgi:hypothetical protein
MKTIAIVIITVFLLPAYHSSAQAPNWSMAVAGLSTHDNYGSSLGKDDAGNTYVLGVFENDINLGGTVLHSISDLDIFLAKYNVSGTLAWATRIGGPGSNGNTLSVGPGMAVDHDGTIYITGRANYYLAAGNDTTTMPGYNIFYAKFNTNGQKIWIKYTACPSQKDAGQKIVLDNVGHFFVTGVWGEEVSIPATMNFGNDQLVSKGNLDMFVAKLDTNGNYIWARSAGGIWDEYGQGIAVDNSGNVFVTGSTQSPAMHFGGDSVITYTLQSAFIAKYDNNGILAWAKSPRGSAVGYAVATDNDGNALMAGGCRGNLVFDTTTVHSAQNSFLLAKYSPAGNIVWARCDSGNGQDQAILALATDAASNIYATGAFNGDVYIGNDTVTGGSGYHMMVAKYDKLGIPKWATKPTAEQGSFGSDIIKGNLGDVYVTGSFSNTAVFGGTIITTSTPQNDNMFLARLSGATGVPVQTVEKETFTIYPNPGSATISVTGTLENYSTMQVYDIAGRKLMQMPLTHTPTIDISGLADGLYQLRLCGGNSEATKMFVVKK